MSEKLCPFYSGSHNIKIVKTGHNGICTIILKYYFPFYFTDKRETAKPLKKLFGVEEE